MELTILQSIFLGMVQGITEFIPVSSSGHLMLVSYIFGFEEVSIGFAVALHVGTLGAVVIYFWRDWLNILRLKNDMPVYQKNPNLLKYIIIGLIPAVVVGFLIDKYADINALIQQPLAVALMIFLGGAILWMTDYFSKTNKNIEQLTGKDAWIIGIFQIIALIPGISRSGITISTARVLGFNRVDSARFSFLLGTPLIFGAGLMQFSEFKEISLSLEFWIGILTSFVSAWLAIHFFLALIKKVSYGVFFWYSLFLVGLIISVAFFK
jgi:undecaprenyl-diphosphatase